MSHSLLASLIVPSSINAYSMGTEYMKQWFLKKFAKGFFKNVHIDDKHVSDDFKQYKKIEDKIKLQKPNLSIIPNLSTEFDFGRVDSYPYGIENYVKRGNKDDAFFKDTSNKLYLGWRPEINRINFQFVVRLQTKAQAIDVYRFMRIAFRIGYTQGKDEILDFHIPYRLMLKLASDAGFEIDTNRRIIEIQKFLFYLNSHSLIPIIIKYRDINGKFEFFMRLQDMYVHIGCPDELQIGSGERIGMIKDNYTIEMNCILDIPGPKEYSYFSQTKDEDFSTLNLEDKNEGFNIFSVKLPTVPEKNKQGWDLLLQSDYTTDTLDSGTIIDFKELVKGDNDLYNLIIYNNKIGISPSTFIDFTLRNGGNVLPYTINWHDMTMTINQKLESLVINIFAYLDIGYINEQIISKTEIEKGRY